MPLLDQRSRLHPHPRRRVYHYFAHKSEFVVALYSMTYHGRAAMVTLQELSTSRFVTVTKEEFERNWVEC